MRDRPSPLPSTFLSKLQALEEAYLHNSDPVEQSGFYGGPERWRAEREPILAAISAGRGVTRYRLRERISAGVSRRVGAGAGRLDYPVRA